MKDNFFYGSVGASNQFKINFAQHKAESHVRTSSDMPYDRALLESMQSEKCGVEEERDDVLEEEEEEEEEDEVYINEKSIQIDSILLAESIIYFKIFNIYSQSSEKIHEVLSLNKGVAAIVRRDAPEQSTGSQTDIQLNKTDDTDKLLGNMKTYRKGFSQTQLILRGLNINLDAATSHALSRGSSTAPRLLLAAALATGSRSPLC